MSHVDTEGVRHPDPWDEFTAEGLEHIWQCPECQRRMPHLPRP